MKTPISGIILSAGASTRMGSHKALLKIQNKTFLDIAIENQIQSGADPVVVILGALIEPLKQIAEKHQAQIAINQNWEKGQQSSLKIGLASLPENTLAIVSLIDHPKVSLETYKLLVEKAQDFNDVIIQPTFQQKTGHPLILKGHPVDLLKTHPLIEGGTKKVLESIQNLIIKVEVSDPFILQDLDTPNDL